MPQQLGLKFGLNLAIFRSTIDQLANTITRSSYSHVARHLVCYFDRNVMPVDCSELDNLRHTLAVGQEIKFCVAPERAYLSYATDLPVKKRDSIVEFETRSRLLLVRDVECHETFLGINGLIALKQASGNSRAENAHHEKRGRELESIPFALALLESVLNRTILYELTRVKRACTFDRRLNFEQELNLALQAKIPAVPEFEPEARGYFIDWLVQGALDGRILNEAIR